MRWRGAEEALGMARFLTLLHRWESAELNQEEAAELLGVTERTFRRWTRRRACQSPNRCDAWVTAPPARSAAATMAASER